jgi:hypothetical protein
MILGVLLGGCESSSLSRQGAADRIITEGPKPRPGVEVAARQDYRLECQLPIRRCFFWPCIHLPSASPRQLTKSLLWIFRVETRSFSHLLFSCTVSRLPSSPDVSLGMTRYDIVQFCPTIFESHRAEQKPAATTSLLSLVAHKTGHLFPYL